MAWGIRKAVVLISTVVISGFVGLPAIADTVEDVVRQALATNPRLSILLSNRESIDYELRRDRGLYLPQVDISGGFGVQRMKNFRTTTAGGAQVTSKEYLRQDEYSIIISQRIFDGFDAASRIGRQKARVASASRRVFENAEVLGLDAINAMLEVHRQRVLLSLSEDNLKTHLAMLEKIKLGREGEVISEADLVQTEARLARARSTTLETQNEMRDAIAAYQRIVGELPADIELPDLPADALPKTIEEALALAKDKNPTTKIFAADIDVAKREIDIADVKFYPSVSLEAGHSYADGKDGSTASEKSYFAMLRMRWNLYRGGSDLADRRAAVARLMEARSRRYNAANGAVEEMRISWNAYEIAKDRIVVLKEAVDYGEQTVDAYLEQFNAPQRGKTLLDVLDAENELFVTKGQLRTVESNHLSAAFRILAAGGELLNTLGIEAPKQANPATPSFSQHVFPKGLVAE